MDSATCRVNRRDNSYQGKQGLDYFAGVGAENVGAKHLCLHLLIIPAGGRACAHLHRLGEHARMRGGDFMYIPPGVPHLPVNASATEPAQAVIARTDPNEQESVVLLPELDALDSPALSRKTPSVTPGGRG